MGKRRDIGTFIFVHLSSFGVLKKLAVIKSVRSCVNSKLVEREEKNILH